MCKESKSLSYNSDIILVYPQKNTLLFGVPLGLAYIGAVLREDGFRVHVIDMRYRNEEKLFETLQSQSQVRCVGFYVSSEIAPYVLELASKIKEIKPSIKIIAGGPHATINPDELLAGEFDVVVKGEGEMIVRELMPVILKDGELKNIKGISYGKDGKTFHNQPAEFVKDLDKLPLPAYDLFPDIEKTLMTGLAWTSHLPFTHVLVSRGCPFQCTFCQPTLDKMFGRKIRRLSPGRTIELLSYLKREYDVNEIFFEDDLLLSKAWKSWLKELTDLMLTENLDLRWWGQARANSADREILEMAMSAGCYMVMCGIESGCQKTLDFYRKGITVEDIRSFFKLCNETGLMTVAEIIFGAPKETLADAQETIALMKEVDPDMIWVSILTPYPGTYLTDWLKENGVEFEHELARIDRGIRKKKIESSMTEDEIFNAVAYLTESHISWRRMICSSSYRKAYRQKLGNLLKKRMYGTFTKLLVWTILRPLLKPLQIIYYRNDSTAMGRFFKRILSVLRP